MPTSNLEQRDDLSSRGRQIFVNTSRSQTKLQGIHIHQTETTWNSTEQYALEALQQVAAVERKLIAVV